MIRNNSVVRHKINPFVKNMIVPVGKQNVRISRIGKNENILVNQNTGEVIGHRSLLMKK